MSGLWGADEGANHYADRGRGIIPKRVLIYLLREAVCRFKLTLRHARPRPASSALVILPGALLRAVMNGDRLDIQASVDLAGLEKLKEC
jgi:hypothetical protein